MREIIINIERYQNLRSFRWGLAPLFYSYFKLSNLNLIYCLSVVSSAAVIWFMKFVYL